MGCQKPRKSRKGRASEQCMTRRGFHIYQKGDRIRTLRENRRNVASQRTVGVWCWVSFAGEGPCAGARTTPRGRGAGASI